MQSVREPIALIDDCAVNLPDNLIFRKLNPRNREVVFIEEYSQRRAKMDIEVSSVARSADFGIYHPDYNYFFAIQSFFGIPDVISLRFTHQNRAVGAIAAIFSFASLLLPLILRSDMDLNISK